MASWGVISASCAFVTGPASFYSLRFLLGLAEAGFVPGMLFYLTLWFPKEYRVRYAAGCRIRRVRVAPAREGGAKGKGAVILSKRLLSELREQPPT